MLPAIFGSVCTQVTISKLNPSELLAYSIRIVFNSTHSLTCFPLKQIYSSPDQACCTRINSNELIRLNQFVVVFWSKIDWIDKIYFPSDMTAHWVDSFSYKRWLSQLTSRNWYDWMYSVFLKTDNIEEK